MSILSLGAYELRTLCADVRQDPDEYHAHDAPGHDLADEASVPSALCFKLLSVEPHYDSPTRRISSLRASSISALSLARRSAHFTNWSSLSR